MALRGNLRDFPAAEILQLLGNQTKTGCLTVEAGSRHAVVYVSDGRIVSTREPGMAKDDPLLRHLRGIHRLSDEQLLGIESIHRESHRDLEDLLVNGRYLESEELAVHLERQIFDDLMQVTRWTEGSYSFVPERRWPFPPRVRLSIDGALIEVARRADEEKRYAKAMPDPGARLSVHDLPDPDEPLIDEERELFGIVDGRKTVAEVIAAAPLTEFEATEALFRMIEAGWIQLEASTGPAPAPAPVVTAGRRERRWGRELVFAAAVIVSLIGLRVTARLLAPPAAAHAPAEEVAVAAQIRDLRFALELYRREQGRYPEHLGDLLESRTIDATAMRVPGYDVRYRALRSGSEYSLELDPQR